MKAGSAVSRFVWAGVLVSGLLAAAATVFAPFLLPGSNAVDTALVSLERATGMTVAVRGTVEVRLMPHPAIVAHDVTLSEPAKWLLVSAQEVRATLSLPALLRGLTVVDAVSLDGVSGVLDGDAAARLADVVTAAPEASPSSDPPWPNRLTITSGLLQIRSTHPALSGFAGDLRLAVDGLRSGAASMSGGLIWHGERAEISGHIDSLANLLRGEAAAGSVHVKSRLAAGSVSGSWTRGWHGGLAGTVTASAPSLASALRLVGVPPGALAGVGRFSFSGTTEPTPDGLAFGEAHVVINDNSLEGAVGVQAVDGRPTLVGTLAADVFDLSPFAATLPPLRAPGGGLSTEVLPLSGDLPFDADLRLSAGRLDLRGLRAEDAALSLLDRKGRTELSIGEARAYGGSVKARLVADREGSNELAMKGEMSWSQLDVAALAEATEAKGSWGGTTSGSLTLEGSGGTPLVLAQRLTGKGHSSWYDGHLQAPAAVASLFKAGAASEAPATSHDITFDLASVSFSVRDGEAAIERGDIAGPDSHVGLQGRASLLDRRYSLATSPEASAEGSNATGEPEPTRGFEGAWGERPRRLLRTFGRGSPVRYDAPQPPQ